MAVPSTGTPQPGTWRQCSESPRNAARDFSNAGLSHQANAYPRFKAGEERNSVARIAIWDTGAARLALCAFLPRVPGLELRLAAFHSSSFVFLHPCEIPSVPS